MTRRLRPGVYEDMITAALEAEINARREDGWRVDVHPTDATSRPEFLARHVYELLRRALEAIHGDGDAQAASQVALANRLVEALFEHGAMADDRVAEAARLLTSPWQTVSTTSSPTASMWSSSTSFTMRRPRAMTGFSSA